MANEKHIFIGIGGAGVKTVSQIKSKVYEKKFSEATASKSRLQAMNDDYRFIFIDTDQRDIDEANKANRESFESGKVPFISPQTDLVNLGRANPQAIYYEAKKNKTTLINKRILEACSQELANRIPDQPLSFGAGAFRMKSRIAFAHSLANFQSKLQSAISSLNDVKTVGGEDCIIYYWVISSTLGGTGSGIFNDVLYHVNQLHHQIVGNGDPQLVLTMFMPKVYIDCNSTEEKYPLNAFGVFSELDAFKKMSYSESQKAVMHRLAFNDDYSLVDSSSRYCPFYYLIPIDIQTDKGTSLGDTATMYRNTAEMLYHLHSSQAGATFRSDIDNYINDIMDKNHSEFLVPMGYVSLQKPIEQFNKYIRARFRRDILGSWLLCNDKKHATVKNEEIKGLYNELFKDLDPGNVDSIAYSFIGSSNEALEILERVDTNDNDGLKKALDPADFDSISALLSNVKERINNESKDERLSHYKKLLISGIWEKAENWICNYGLAYTRNAINKVREYMNKIYNQYGTDLASVVDAEGLASLSNDAMENEFIEGTLKPSNKKQIAEYIDKAKSYVNEFTLLEIKRWAHELMRDFCTDENNDELSKLERHIASLIAKAEEMDREASKFYNHLATEFGEASLDVTTVYLPMLKTICDGNGWKIGNFFSKMYTKVISADEDTEETPSRPVLAKFLTDHIYKTTDDDLVDAKYKISIEKKQIDDANAEETEKKTRIRFFANQKIIEQGNVQNEKIIGDFLTLATTILDQQMHHNKEVRENWENRKISTFFGDLTNEEKDEVRRALSPSLFFSYNTNRIDVTKKEEHIIFVANSSELASEMLGYQKGNTKHRFEKSENENTALVLKSKFGLALEDYRIYDSIKRVYESATFREKYHFHHDFAQYLDKLTIDNLPYDILPQHRSFVKMLILDKFRNELDKLFYRDHYDEKNYTNTMYYSDSNYEQSFKIALPEALITNNERTNGLIALRIEADGRKLYQEIEGQSFVDRFEIYTKTYHNSRFGETTNKLIQAVLTTKIPNQDELGEFIIKNHYTKKREVLLKEFSEKKSSAALPEERRLYSIFFNILRDEFGTVNEFKKS